jgi:hypothetical protein
MDSTKVNMDIKSVIKRRYVRCAKGTRRNKKSHACRSVAHKKCAKGTRRSKKTGKCEAKVVKSVSPVEEPIFRTVPSTEPVVA